MKSRSMRLLCLLLLTVAALVCAPAFAADGFDPPVSKQVVDLGFSPNCDPPCPIVLACYYYPSFMVKEYDTGSIGADLMAIAPRKGKSLPVCSKELRPGEIKLSNEWGYFLGVKGGLVFLETSDGANGGDGFGVFDARTGELLFQDDTIPSNDDTRKRGQPSEFRNLHRTTDASGTVVLNYMRVVATDCDIHRDGLRCWNRLRAKHKLKPATPPVCKGYKGVKETLESVISYPVQTTLTSPPVTKVLDGPIRCWATS